MNLDNYLWEIENAAEQCVIQQKTPQGFLEDLLNRKFSLASELIECRKETLIQGEVARARDLFCLKIFPSLPDNERIAYITVCIDLEAANARQSIIRRCEKYSYQHELFQQVPELFNCIRRKENGLRDRELIDISMLEDTTHSGVFRYKRRYIVVDSYIKPIFIDWLTEEFRTAPLFLRIFPHTVYDSLPPFRIEEATVIPTDPHWWKKLSLYNNTRTGGSYFLEDCPFSGETAEQSWEYAVDKIRKLETIVSRDNSGRLSMMLEELSERSRNHGFIIGRCIHLDTFNPVGTSFEEAMLAHLDLAINVYCGEAIDIRLTGSLAKGKVVDADYRTHLLRIENIPFKALFAFAKIFFQSNTLVKEWLQDQFQSPDGTVVHTH